MEVPDSQGEGEIRWVTPNHKLHLPTYDFDHLLIIITKFTTFVTCLSELFVLYLVSVLTYVLILKREMQYLNVV